MLLRLQGAMTQPLRLPGAARRGACAWVAAAWGGADGAGLWFVVAGAVDGLVLGLAVFFASSAEQWPVNREFLDVDAIREAARRHDER